MKLAINQATLKKTPMDIFLKAISKSGFEGVELRRDETFQYLKNNSIDDLKLLLHTYNLECITFNAVELFSLCPEAEFQHILDYTERLMKIGIEIGCDMIITVPSFNDDPTISEEKVISHTVKRLKILSRLADNYSFKLGFEPLGFLNCSVRKIELALEIIKSEGLPDMGLVIDTFHYFVGGHTVEELNHIELEKLWLIHINDSIKKPLNQLQDSDRILPSQGFFNLEGFMKQLKNLGYNQWLSLELFNEQIWEKNPFNVAEDSYATLNRII